LKKCGFWERKEKYCVEKEKKNVKKDEFFWRREEIITWGLSLISSYDWLSQSFCLCQSENCSDYLFFLLTLPCNCTSGVYVIETWSNGSDGDTYSIVFHLC
jgi:hypothetical protein